MFALQVAYLFYNPADSGAIVQLTKDNLDMTLGMYNM